MNAPRTLPDGVPDAIARTIQTFLIGSGCPPLLEADGIWGDNSALQFAKFLEASGNSDLYDPFKSEGVTIRQLYRLFEIYYHSDRSKVNRSPRECIISPNPNPEWEEQDFDPSARLTVDLRIPQQDFPPQFARGLRDHLRGVGCPVWRADPVVRGQKKLAWDKASADQFKQFLRVTSQETKYANAVTMGEVTELFNGWKSRADFVPTLANLPTYCQPIPECDLNEEIGKLLNESPEIAPLKSLFQSLYAWSSDKTRHRVLERMFPRMEEPAGEGQFPRSTPLAYLQDKVEDTEAEVRQLLLKIVEGRHPTTCGKCSLRANYDIAMAAGLPAITAKQLRLHTSLWRDIDTANQAIKSKELLHQQKLKLRAERDYQLKGLQLSDRARSTYLASQIESLNKEISDLSDLLEQERTYRLNLLEPIKNAVRSEIESAKESNRNPAAEFRREILKTTCLAGSGPYYSKNN